MSPMRKLKPIEAGDGSYGGMVLSAFDSLSQLAPSGMDGGDVVSAAVGATGALAVELANVCRRDELAAQGAGVADGRKVGEHLLASVHRDSIEKPDGALFAGCGGGMISLLRLNPAKVKPAGLCCKCGQSALGRASDGLEYCHRVTCCDWKAERWKAIEMRRSA